MCFILILCIHLLHLNVSDPAVSLVSHVFVIIIINLFLSKTQHEVQRLIYFKHHKRHVSVHQEPSSDQLPSLDTTHISVGSHILYSDVKIRLTV
jgi:hypothetical protein